MEGCGGLRANHDLLMDCKGARALAQRLKLGDIVAVGAIRPRAAVPEGAAPIFHWFGIEPPDGSAGAEAPAGRYESPSVAPATE